ncbi:MAG: SAP domain-containing protein [Euryarchaeota archaeon]|nr:SAP domain-containing protein [Euryarchaeota archaeon]
MDAGPTLDEIHAQEARSAAELKAKKAAALAEAMEDEESEDAEEETTEEVAEAPAEVAEAPKPVAEAPAAEEVVEEAPAETSADYSSMTVAQLKELLKEAGKPVSGKKAELIERLQE